MAAVTQSIDSYIMGVSTAPDKDIAPGYVKDARNVYPDITYGMTKRPGTTLINDLGNSAIVLTAPVTVPVIVSVNYQLHLLLVIFISLEVSLVLQMTMLFLGMGLPGRKLFNQV